ncbi:hypothetical protein P153DRAFT_394435 [Dothidotthia symphoricarpi CBS 119687]|uniref:Uncharacterized protein n=1 Tax=Dothidotthia symphoricarpi CBS 119687 TaxID=1392245 RepID=A0A6A6AN14_9PLEO|nr:uncharacterized protein P153DRAFT_394435 [Dothidotthia symphoricarpi CBS 119687]KAF2132277.1 hypothetical protein P153DRAFT_394435 [Dothidotthia symphoricarpi CBS 119687]
MAKSRRKNTCRGGEKARETQRDEEQYESAVEFQPQHEPQVNPHKKQRLSESGGGGASISDDTSNTLRKVDSEVLVPEVLGPLSNLAFIQIPWPYDADKAPWTISEFWYRSAIFKSCLKGSDDFRALCEQWVPVLKSICEQATATAKQEQQTMTKDLEFLKTAIATTDSLEDVVWPEIALERSYTGSAVQDCSPVSQLLNLLRTQTSNDVEKQRAQLESDMDIVQGRLTNLMTLCRMIVANRRYGVAIINRTKHIITHIDNAIGDQLREACKLHARVDRRSLPALSGRTFEELQAEYDELQWRMSLLREVMEEDITKEVTAEVSSP